MVVVVLFALTVVILSYLYYLTSKSFGYWKKRNVPHIKPTPIFGNYKDYILGRKNVALVCNELCYKFQDEPYFGTFFGNDPTLVLLKPDIIKQVFVKDFYYFNSRSHMDYMNEELLFKNLFFSYGDTWKIARQNLTPLFSGAKLKNMFHLIQKSAYMFEEMLEYEMSISNEIDIKDIMVRYTMDCLCSCAFGVDSNTQATDSQNNPFTIMGQRIFNVSFKSQILTLIQNLWPRIFYACGFKIYPNSIYKFFYTMITNVFDIRGNKPSSQNDFVNMILDWKKNKYIVGDSITNLKTGNCQKIEKKVDNELLVSQCILFFAAGFETSSNALCFTVYELAKNQEAQRRVQKEIDEYLSSHGNKLTHDCVNLPYVYACVAEVNRMYPILGVLTRETVEDYAFPTGLQIEKGTRIHLPVWHIHRNPENFPEPDKFKPERFLPDAECEIKPYTFFPFGEGPRICIGARFSTMQATPALIAFFMKYSVELAEGTPETPKFNFAPMVLSLKSSLRLKISLRAGCDNRKFNKTTE